MVALFVGEDIVLLVFCELFFRLLNPFADHPFDFVEMDPALGQRHGALGVDGVVVAGLVLLHVLDQRVQAVVREGRVALHESKQPNVKLAEQALVVVLRAIDERDYHLPVFFPLPSILLPGFPLLLVHRAAEFDDAVVEHPFRIDAVGVVLEQVLLQRLLLLGEAQLAVDGRGRA